MCTASCTSFPDTCSGTGAFGLDRFCMAYLADATQNPVGLCMDRRPPGLTQTRLDAMGTPAQLGDNCYTPAGSDLWTQCPSDSHCEVDFTAGTGLCVTGCDPAATPASNQYCSVSLGITTGRCLASPSAPTGQGFCVDTSL